MKRLPPNARLALSLVGFIALMVGITYASVPLYTLFCRATGFGGTTQRIAAAPQENTNHIKDRFVTVSFDGNVDAKLPWDFVPAQRNLRVKLGEVAEMHYHAHNRSSKTTTGTATYNVQPDKAGVWFDKIQCFCFTKQTLKPGQTADLVVQFTVDPAMADDHENDDVQNITLSYTFFLAKN